MYTYYFIRVGYTMYTYYKGGLYDVYIYETMLYS